MHYKFLILSMSCNNEFYELSRLVTHDTWARDVIEGKYPDYGFFSYTTSNNGKDYIEDNVIYLNCSDNIGSTYTKTIKCFDFLRKNNITFDYIIRTNTSNFINVDFFDKNLSNDLNILQSDLTGFSVIYTHNEVKGYSFSIFGGHFLILSNRFVNLLLDNYSLLNDHNDLCKTIVYENFSCFDDLSTWKYTDDLLISTYFHWLNFNKNTNLQSYALPFKYFFNYKNIVEYYHKNFSVSDIFLFNNVEDPNIINFCLLARVRVPTDNQENTTSLLRTIEFAHMYELYHAKKKYDESAFHIIYNESNVFC